MIHSSNTPRDNEHFNALVSLLRVGGDCSRSSPDLYQYATQHGLLGSLLKQYAGEDPRLRHIRARTVLQLSDADLLVSKFNEMRIPAVLLKGADLISRLGLDPGTRPMSDLDFLIPTDSRAEAGLVLTRAGYVRLEGQADRLDREQGGAWRYCRQVGEFPSTVEIHDRSYPDSPLRFSDFADETGTLLTDEAALYWLARNAAWHGFSERLLFIYDLDRFVRTRARQLRPDRFTGLIERSGESELVRLALRVANRLFETPVDGLVPPNGPENMWVDRCAKGLRPLPAGPRSLFPILLLDRGVDRFKEIYRGIRRLGIGGAANRYRPV